MERYCVRQPPTPIESTKKIYNRTLDLLKQHQEAKTNCEEVSDVLNKMDSKDLEEYGFNKDEV